MLTALKSEYQLRYNSSEIDSGRIVNQFHMDRLCKLFADHGGEVVMGNPNAHLNRILELTVIKEPSHDSPLM